MNSFVLGEDDYDTYKNPIEGKTYVSPPIQNEYGEAGTIRIVTRGIDQTESYETAKVKGEVILRKTAGGKNIITAKVFENSRKIYILNIQQYTASTGNPHKLGFAFLGDEITKLFNFIRDVQTMRFGSNRYQRLSDDDIEHLQVTNSQALALFRQNQELFADIVKSKITTQDIVAFAYRKKQLEYFSKLINTDFLIRWLQERNLKMKLFGNAFLRKINGFLDTGLDMFFSLAWIIINWSRLSRGFPLPNMASELMR